MKSMVERNIPIDQYFSCCTIKILPRILCPGYVSKTDSGQASYSPSMLLGDENIYIILSVA